MSPEQPPPDKSEPKPLRVDRRRSEWRTRCTICLHPERARIELAMARGAGKRAVARRFNVSADAVWRHWDGHVGEAVKVARKAEVLKPGALLEQLVEEEDTGLLETLRIARAAVLHQLDLANELDDRPAVAALAGQLHKNAELVGRYTGEIRNAASTTVNNLVLSPDYLALRLKLTQVLRAFPEAAQAVAAVFREAEGGTVRQIEAKPVEVAHG